MFSAICVVLAGAAAAIGADNVRPLAHAHAHNDYEHARPLFDALDHGFCSVEADIWLRPEGLLVAHDRIRLKPERTLEKLYLDPLRQRVKQSGGRVYRDGPPFYLLIDIKSDAEMTYAALDKVLANYADVLTVFRDGQATPGAVTVIVSGNRPFETMARQNVRYAAIDGRPEDLDKNPPAGLYPWISGNWTLLFQWNGEGPFPTEQKRQLEKMVGQAHQQGRKIRFWSTAEKETMWRELLAAGVDFINTDKLADLETFLLNQERASK